MEFRRTRSASKLTNSHNQHNPHNKYQIGEMIGQGQFGKVYKAVKKQFKYGRSGKYSQQNIFAIKTISLGKLKKNPKLQQLLQNQVQILTNLKHPNIIKFQEFFIWEDKIYMVYEYCQGGNLQDIMPLDQNKAVDVFRKIIKACSFAQKNNILHRDLKPANILFKKGQPQVADWGFSRYLKEQFTATSFVGSPAYMAPEVLTGSQYTNKADVWSFGVMVYQSLFNQMPWPAKNIKDLLQKLKISSQVRYPKNTLPILKTIINCCLKINPDSRASFQNLQKVIQISYRSTKTQSQIQNNPQENSNYKAELSQTDIKKCAYFLQFAKYAQKFQDQQSKQLCLDLILAKLRKIKDINFKKPVLQQNYMTPCLSQRRINLTKRDHPSPKTSSKLSKRQNYHGQPSQSRNLLQKQILLIQKIKQNISKVLSSTKSPSKSKLLPSSTSTSTSITNTITIPKMSERSIIKQLLKKLLRNVSISSQAYQSRQKSKNTSRKQLIQMNCILQVIMYEQLVEDGDSNESSRNVNGNMKLKDRVKQMQQVSISTLMRSVNHRILYVNQQYCKS